MPSGRTHDRVTLWTLPWIVGFSYLLTRSGELTLIVAGAFLFSGLMFGPDLDIYSVQYQRWGVLRWIWLPYQSLLRHRSFLSHGLIIGTVFRLFYLSSILTFLAVIGVTISQLVWRFNWNLQQFLPQIIQLIRSQYLLEVIACLVGLEVGAMSHSISDWLGSTCQRSQKRYCRPSIINFKKKKRRRK